MRGYWLLDEVGTKVGRIDEVYDHWLLVRLGRVTDRHVLVPRGDAVAAGAHAWVPYRLETIRAAAVAAGEGPPSGELESQLRRQYGLRDAVGSL